MPMVFQPATPVGLQFLRQNPNGVYTDDVKPTGKTLKKNEVQRLGECISLSYILRKVNSRY